MTLYKTESGKLFNDATGQFSDPITESGCCPHVTSWFEQLPSFEHTQWYRDLKIGDEIEFLSPYPDRWDTCIVSGRDNNDQVVREYAPGMTASVPMNDARPVQTKPEDTDKLAAWLQKLTTGTIVERITGNYQRQPVIFLHSEGSGHCVTQSLDSAHKYMDSNSHICEYVPANHDEYTRVIVELRKRGMHQALDIIEQERKNTRTFTSTKA